MLKGLTREQVDTLRAWGAGLERSGATEELKAAGRAIGLLVAEVDQLDRALWHQRAGVSDLIEGAAEPAGPEPADIGRQSFLGALAKRLAPVDPQQP